MDIWLDGLCMVLASLHLGFAALLLPGMLPCIPGMSRIIRLYRIRSDHQVILVCTKKIQLPGLPCYEVCWHVLTVGPTSYHGRLWWLQHGYHRAIFFWLSMIFTDLLSVGEYEMSSISVHFSTPTLSKAGVRHCRPGMHIFRSLLKALKSLGWKPQVKSMWPRKNPSVVFFSL